MITSLCPNTYLKHIDQRLQMEKQEMILKLWLYIYIYIYLSVLHTHTHTYIYIYIYIHTYLLGTAVIILMAQWQITELGQIEKQ